MQINAKTQSHLLEKLLSQLQEFGLDPRDWNLIPKTHGQARLIHRRDRDFCFVGAIDARRGKWIRLHLESL